jgi:4-hydroxy-2-oxoheptanedioate aldolase
VAGPGAGMTSGVHRLRRELRAALRGNGARCRPAAGTFIKLGALDVVEMAAAAGFDFIVVDLEHSVLTEQEAVALVRYADVSGLAALVRLPAVDAPLINRLLENGAAGIQLSMLRSVGQANLLREAALFPPSGARSVSLTNHVAAGSSLPGYLSREAADPPLLVGQIETAAQEPLEDVLEGLDACFVGTTDLAVSLGTDAGSERAEAAVASIAAVARKAGIPFGGWAPTASGAIGLGLADAGFLVLGSDLQFLAASMRAATPHQEGQP